MKNAPKQKNLKKKSLFKPNFSFLLIFELCWEKLKKFSFGSNWTDFFFPDFFSVTLENYSYSLSSIHHKPMCFLKQYFACIWILNSQWSFPWISVSKDWPIVESKELIQGWIWPNIYVVVHLSLNCLLPSLWQWSILDHSEEGVNPL